MTEQTESRDPDEICGRYVWPFTENNRCVLKPEHAGDHEDARGRKFDNASYLRGERNW